MLFFIWSHASSSRYTPITEWTVQIFQGMMSLPIQPMDSSWHLCGLRHMYVCAHTCIFLSFFQCKMSEMWKWCWRPVFLQDDAEGTHCLPMCEQVLCDLLGTRPPAEEEKGSWSTLFPELHLDFASGQTFFSWKMNQRISSVDNCGSMWLEKTYIIPMRPMIISHFW